MSLIENGVRLARGPLGALPFGDYGLRVLDELAGLTSMLGAIEQRIVHFAEAPHSLAEVNAELRRIAAAIESVPALRDDMASLPATIDQLDARMIDLLGAINQLMGSVEQLAAATHPLHTATASLERLGERLHTEAGAARQPRRWLRGAQESV